MDPNKIEERLDIVAAGNTEVSMALGGVRFERMQEIFEFAKLLSLSKQAVPDHLRNEPGVCLAVCIQALEWRFSPFAVANKSYVVNGRLAYESQLVHAVIEQRAPIKGRLRHRYEGEGDDRVCVVWATPKGEADPLEYRSPPIAKITPKNSPLWKSKSDLQLYYVASRDWARIYFPDVLLGVFAEDELRDSDMRDITPKPDISKRLKKDKGTAGFKPNNIDTAVNGGLGPQSETGPDQIPATEPQPSSTTTEFGVPDAMEAGREARRKNRALFSFPTEWTDETWKDAFKAGWNEVDDELKPKAKAKSDTPMADALGAG